MKILLVAGARHKTYIKYMSDYTMVNARVNLTLSSLRDYLQHYEPTMDAIIITDGGLFSNRDENVRMIGEVLKDISEKALHVVVLTQDFYLRSALLKHESLKILSTEFLRAGAADFNAVVSLMPKDDYIESIIVNDSTGSNQVKDEYMGTRDEGARNEETFWATDNTDGERGEMQEEEKQAKRRIFKIGKKTLPVTEDDSYKVSRVQNKAIIFTGRPGAGITGTLANVAYAAAKKSMRVIILDFDLVYRSINLYFNEFCSKAEESEDVSRSLIMTLANPQNYLSTAIAITSNLWVTGLGYQFNDKQAMESFCTEQKITALVSVLKNKFDYVFIDLPFSVIPRCNSIMAHADAIALCVENNLHGAITTIASLMHYLKPDDISYLNMKSKLIVTKYNDESVYNDEILTPEKFAEFLTDEICDYFRDEMSVAGKVPYVKNYDRQIEKNIPIYETSTLLMQCYDEILARL